MTRIASGSVPAELTKANTAPSRTSRVGALITIEWLGQHPQLPAVLVWILGCAGELAGERADLRQTLRGRVRGFAARPESPLA